MARIAAILLGSGAGSVDSLEETLTTLERDHSGMSPDVYVTLEPFHETARTWLADNASRIAKAYTSPHSVGWPIMVNTVVDQQIEGGEFDYDIVVMLTRGITMGEKGWLRWIVESIEDDNHEVVYSLGGSENPATERNVIDNGDGTFIVPRLWGGVVAPVGLLAAWRCVPYQPVRGTSWLDDFSDHCVIANRLMMHKPALKCGVPEIRKTPSAFMGFDGGQTYAKT